MNFYNDVNFKERRRCLRKSQTDAERKIWQMVRNKQICNLKFFRQYGVDKFILDFYCPEKRLAIEIDGGQHTEAVSYDSERTKKINNLGIKVIRFWNNEVLQNIEGVYEKILEVLKYS
ncbi:MAG: DUF559 domain-containing protein [Patescibacteria group bacterium]